MTGVNGWKCRPRDCTYCSHGINGFTCGGNNCSSCIYGINGWLCQPAASISICTLSYTNTAVAPLGWTVSARYEVDQQNDVGFAKLFVSSSLPLLGAQIRTAAGDVAWQIYPTTSAELGRPIFWARLPALTMYSYPGAAASLAAFSPANGRVAPQYLIPSAAGLRLFLQRADQADYQPAPGAGQNAFSCQVSTGFQADAINARASGTNF